jgi:hypothetical protein
MYQNDLHVIEINRLSRNKEVPILYNVLFVVTSVEQRVRRILSNGDDKCRHILLEYFVKLLLRMWNGREGCVTEVMLSS